MTVNNNNKKQQARDAGLFGICRITSKWFISPDLFYKPVLFSLFYFHLAYGFRFVLSGLANKIQRYIQEHSCSDETHEIRHKI
jgi:hypothetical protein